MAVAQRFGGDLRVFGDVLIETPGTADGSVITRSYLRDEFAAQVRDRATHTGTQMFDTISDGRTYVDGRIEAIVGAAPAALDTLGEIAARLADDAQAASALTNTVTANRQAIDALDGRFTVVETAFGPLVTRVDGVVDALAVVEGRVSATEGVASGAAGDVATLAGEVGALRGDVNALTGAAGDLASQADLDAVEARVDTAEGRLTAVEGVAGAAATAADLTTVTGRVTAVEGVAAAAATDADLDALTVRVGTLESDTAGADALTALGDELRGADTALGGRLTAVEGVAAAAATDADLDAAVARITAVEGVAAAAATDDEFNAAVDALAAADAALDGRIDTLERVSVYRATVGDGSARAFTVAHGLGSPDTEVVVIDLTDGQTVYPVVQRTDNNTARVDFGSYAPAAGSVRVLVKAL